MGDTNLHGVLNMPIECWQGTDFDRHQRHARYVEASQRIITLQEENADLAMLVRRLCVGNNKDAAIKAREYLDRKGLQGSPFRDA